MPTPTTVTLGITSHENQPLFTVSEYTDEIPRPSDQYSLFFNKCIVILPRPRSIDPTKGNSSALSFYGLAYLSHFDDHTRIRTTSLTVRKLACWDRDFDGRHSILANSISVRPELGSLLLYAATKFKDNDLLWRCYSEGARLDFIPSKWTQLLSSSLDDLDGERLAILLSARARFQEGQSALADRAVDFAKAKNDLVVIKTLKELGIIRPDPAAAPPIGTPASGQDRLPTPQAAAAAAAAPSLVRRAGSATRSPSSSRPIYAELPNDGSGNTAVRGAPDVVAQRSSPPIYPTGASPIVIANRTLQHRQSAGEIAPGPPGPPPLHPATFSIPNQITPLPLVRRTLR